LTPQEYELLKKTALAEFINSGVHVNRLKAFSDMYGFVQQIGPDLLVLVPALSLDYIVGASLQLGLTVQNVPEELNHLVFPGAAATAPPKWNPGLGATGIFKAAKKGITVTIPNVTDNNVD